MTDARSLQQDGFARVESDWGEPFWVDSFAGVQFTGLIELARDSNDLGEGGWLPEQETTLFVSRLAFVRRGVQLAPFLGMRLWVRGRWWVVKGVEDTLEFWRLGLTIAQPRESSVPTPVRVIATSARKPVTFTNGLVSIKPPPPS